ncbi:MAG: excinuclease ABC subunit UvrC [Desulfotomaculales bacterium]
MTLADKAAQMPDRPGVYLFRDERGRVLYVGKAKSLSKRVRTYFQRGQPAKVMAMLQRAQDLDFIVTDSEIEALILECNLIKEHRPRYNVVLKDDKNYPYIKITVNEEFPRVLITRRQLQDGARYFGPYTRAGAVHDTLRLLKKLFPFRSCTRQRFGNRRPCLNFHIKRCLAPCTGRVNREEYAAVIREVCLFLEGRHEDLVKDLTARMQEAAGRLEFERAAELRDQIQAIEQVVARQKIVSTRLEDRDVVALAREGDTGQAVVFQVRRGKLVAEESLPLRGTADKSEEEVLAAFIKQYYSRASFIPPEILLNQPLGDEKEVIAAWLAARGGKVRVQTPRRGKKRELVAMAERNAAYLLAREVAAEVRDAEALAELARALELPVPPRRMEAFDISHIQGRQAVASMAVFQDGRPQKDAYRRFRIHSRGPDDFAALAEVVARRFARAEDPKFAPLPDLVLIDGGKGQLNAALKAMRAAGHGEIPVFSLAKEEELVYAPGRPDPVRLPRDAAALHLLQRLRDEAHRFAVEYHRAARTRKTLGSLLEEIEGVGAIRRRALLKAFGSLEDIRRASVDELARVPGMNRKVAEAVHRLLNIECS